MTSDVRFTLDPTPAERIRLEPVLTPAAKHDKEFPDKRDYYVTIDELPERLSEGLSEDERRIYDVTYYLRKRQENGDRYQVRVAEHSNAINRSLVFELEYFDPATEDVEHALSRVMDSVRRVIETLDDDRYDHYRLTRELFGVELAPLYEQDTTPPLDDAPIADEDGHLIPENLDGRM